MKKKIAVLVCGWSTYYLNYFNKGLKRAAKDNNVDIYIFNAYNFTEFSGFPNYTGFAIFNLINYEDFDGVIILADLIGNTRILEKERLKIIKAGKPAITINHKMEGISCIREDNYTGFYELITHLIKDHNISKIGYICGKENSVDFAERYKAYREALAACNIPIDMNFVLTTNATIYQDIYEFFSNYVKEGKPLPEALVCANDLAALAVLKVAEENNIDIPNTLKIIGYDDIKFSKNVNPPLTTIRSNREQIAYEAVNRLLSGNLENIQLKVKNTPIIRSTCGCKFEGKSDKEDFSLKMLDSVHTTENFTTQITHIEEIFTEAIDVFTLLTNLELFLSKSHTFEGSDFCLFLKSDWSSVLINSAENLPQNLSFGTQVQSIVSIQNNKKYLREMINTRDLIPSKMKGTDDEEANIFLFMPIFNHSYVHGYFVTKNNLTMFENHYGYNWTRTIGTNIERFRKKNMYKQMSQQFLKLSTKDALSGMLNRVGLEKLAKPFYSQNKKNGLTTVLFFVDINKMKHINDNFGHLHGDLAVKTIAAAVLETVPKNWLCIRYGGDEFLVVGNSKNYNGEDYCTLIKQRVQKKTSIMQLPYDLSASVGTYSVPPNSDLTLEQAVEKVDDIMYEQKEAYHKAHQ